MYRSLRDQVSIMDGIVIHVFASDEKFKVCVCEREGGSESEREREGGGGRRQRRCMCTIAFPMYIVHPISYVLLYVRI